MIVIRVNRHQGFEFTREKDKKKQQRLFVSASNKTIFYYLLCGKDPCK